MKYRIRKYQIERIALIVLSIESLLILHLYEPTEPIFNFKFKEYFKLDFSQEVCVSSTENLNGDKNALYKMIELLTCAADLNKSAENAG